MDGAIRAICNRLVVAELSSRTSKDLAEQCVKVLELICTREAGAVFEAGGLSCILPFIRDNGIENKLYFSCYNRIKVIWNVTILMEILRYLFLGMILILLLNLQ